MGGLDLDALERLLAEATPGPWYDLRNIDDTLGVYAVVGDMALEYGVPNHDADSLLIVAMRNALPALIARQRTLEAALENLLRHHNAGAVHGTRPFRPLGDCEFVKQARAALARGSGSPEPDPQGQEARDG